MKEGCHIGLSQVLSGPVVFDTLINKVVNWRVKSLARNLTSNDFRFGLTWTGGCVLYISGGYHCRILLQIKFKYRLQLIHTFPLNSN